MLVDDFIVAGETGPKTRTMLEQISQILNEGLYEMKIFAQPPTATAPGTEGECRIVNLGATQRIFIYGGSKWWYTDMIEVV